MKRNRNPRRLYHKKRACWVNRIPVMDLSSWRWLTNSGKPVKRRFANSGIRSRHMLIINTTRWNKIMRCAGSVKDEPM